MSSWDLHSSHLVAKLSHWKWPHGAPWPWRRRCSPFRCEEIPMTRVCTLYDFVDVGQPMARLWNSLVDIDCKPQWIDVCSFCARQKRTRKQKGSSMPQDMNGSSNKISRSSLYASALAPSHQQIPSTKPWLVADLTKSSKCQQSGNKCVFETEENESLQNLKESLKVEATWSHFELQLT